jgi:hypothetical protein
MRFVWPEAARSELRAIDREAAIKILRALDEFGESGEGDVTWRGNGTDTFAFGLAITE